MPKEKCLVIGGCGFLGKNLVEDLLSRGYSVNVFDIKQSDLTPGVSFFQGDICSITDLTEALSGCDAVFHCASPPPSLGNRDLFYRVNVVGTCTLIEACRRSGIRMLVLTSSASVVYNGFDIKAGNEDLPYATRPIDYYTKTKATQEEIVLNANSPELMTCAIRPHGIFGPGDMQCIPGIAQAARAGKTKYKIGDGSNLVDFTYVHNVTHGLILAMESLVPNSPSCGKAYNVTNDEPIPFWDFMAKILIGLEYAPPTKSLPYKFVYFIAMLTQLLCWVISPFKKITPTLTPLKVALAGTHHYYSCARAKADFGYSPRVNLKDGIAKSLLAFEHLKKS